MRFRPQNNLERGNIMEPILILIFLFLVVFVFILPSRGASTFSIGPTSYVSGTVVINPSTTGPARSSAYTGRVRVSPGNTSAIQSYEETVTIENESNLPVDISGWTLANGKGNRTYNVGGNTEHFASDYATIPRGALIMSSKGNIQSDIVLDPNGQAIVTTGSIGNQYPFPIVSFKENECTGYLGDQNTYNYYFSTQPGYSCVMPTSEPGASSLDRQCHDFLSTVGSCTMPKINSVDRTGATVDRNGHTCQGCVNGVALSNQCLAFIQSHLSYDSCLANHAGDPGFYSKTWQVYLSRATEMWADDHDTITLYDQSGKVVDYYTY